MKSRDLSENIEQCVNSLGEKFLKWPNNFFTESDAHSFLYYYIFRSGPRELKVFYPTSDPRNKTVLIHREYPTSFRYKKETMVLDEKEGGRGHYDLVVLNPDFVNAYRIEEVIAQSYKKCRRETPYHLLAAIEFKLITRPLGKSLVEEIHKDFQKLSWALESKQTKQAYMIIFNRAREEKRFREELLPKMAKQNSRVKGIYIESIIKKKKHYNIVYLNNWKWKLRFSLDLDRN